MLRRASSLPLELPLDPAGGLSFGAEPSGERAASVVGDLPELGGRPRSRPTLGCPPRVRMSALASSGSLADLAGSALRQVASFTLTPIPNP